MDEPPTQILGVAGISGPTRIRARPTVISDRGRLVEHGNTGEFRDYGRHEQDSFQHKLSPPTNEMDVKSRPAGPLLASADRSMPAYSWMGVFAVSY